MDGANTATTITGTQGADNLVGTALDEVILGRRGRDVLDGGAGINTLFGGAGADRYVHDGTDGGTNTISDKLGLNTLTVIDTIGRDSGSFINQGDTLLWRPFDRQSTTLIEGDGAGNFDISTLNWERYEDLDAGIGPYSISLDVITMASDIQQGMDFALALTDGQDVLSILDIPSLGDGFSEIYLNGGADQIVVENTGNSQLYIYGGDGADRIEGVGTFNDFFVGDAGADILIGRGGEDALFGGAGADRLYGGNQADELYGARGGDRLAGGNGDDALFGEAGNDTLYGGGGADVLDGGSGTNALFGGAGSDRYIHNGLDRATNTISDELGQNTLTVIDTIDRDSGSFINQGDTLLWRPFDGASSTLIDGDGTGKFDIATLNWQRYEDVDAGITSYSINLDVITSSDDITGGQDFALAMTDAKDVLSLLDVPDLGGNFSEIYLNGGADALAIENLGGDQIYIYGGNGADRLEGVGRNPDFFFGDQGADRLIGRDGEDFLRGGNGADVLFGGNQSDDLAGGRGGDRVIGGNGSDTLSGDQGNDTLSGGGGADILKGGIGQDQLTGGAGRDTFLFEDGDTGNTSETGDVILDFDQGFDVIDLSAMDADLLLAGDQGFAFGNLTATSNGVWQQATGDGTLVLADQTGDAVADIVILVGGGLTFSENDFVL